MPLTTLGQLKTSPLPQTIQAADDSKKVYIWANQKEDDKAQYSLDDLIDDIITPIKNMISPATDWHTKGTNGILNDFIANFNQSALTDTEKKNWMDKWNKAFQDNPTIDISAELSKVISDGLGAIDDGKGWLSQADKSANGDAKLLELIKNAVTKFFDGLKMSSFIRVDIISKQMDDEINADLKPFHLNLQDDGLDYIKQIKQEALDGIENDFINAKYQTTTPNRPYRIFGQKEAKDNATASFELKFHSQDTANIIAKAAFNKAVSGSNIIEDDGTTIENLQTILSSDTQGVTFDSRFVAAIPEIIKLNVKFPVEVFEKLLGKKAGDEYVKWFNEWDWLIESKLKESFDNSKDHKVVTISLKLRDKVKVINGKGSYPSFNSIEGSNPLTQDVSTDPIKVNPVSYIVDLFKNGYDQIVGQSDAQIATVSEDDLIKLFGHKLIVDEIKENVKPSELEGLSSNAFGGLQQMISDSLKAVETNFKALYPGYDYDPLKVKITFDIKYLLFPDASHHISVTPKIIDGNIDNLPGIDWDASSATPKDVRDKVDAIFTKLDSTHKTIGGFKILEPKVVSALDKASDTLYTLFNNHRELAGADLPFKTSVVGGLKEGEEIQRTNFDQLFKKLKDDLDEYDVDNKNRFTVKYEIEKLDDKHVVISYEITDTKTGESTTKTTAGSVLDNIQITFNGSLDKGQSWLDKLSKAPIDKSDFATHDQVDAFGKRTPLALTDDELDKIFVKYEEYKAGAKTQGVTLIPGGVRKVTDDKGESTYLQIFKASFADPTDSTKTIDHFVELQFTHNFLSQEEIDKAKSQIDKDAGNAQETLDKSTMPQDQKDKLIAQTEAARLALQQMIDKEGSDMSEDKLRGIEEQAAKLPDAATAAAMKAKYDEVHGMLEKQFPNGIPPEVEKLFKDHWQEFEDIIKTDPNILHDAKQLAKLLEGMNTKNLMNVKRSMQLSGKIALLSLGGLLGMGGIVGGANAVKVATTNKKAVNAKTGKIKSSKKLAAISALIGLASIAGSIGTILYLFLVQGGL